MLRVRDIMTTDVVTVTPHTTLRDAIELFAKRHVSGAPVIDGEKVVGVVSTSDVLGFEASNPGVPTARDEVEWADIEQESPESDDIDREDDPTAEFSIDIAHAVAEHLLDRKTYVFNREREFGAA
jgi:CBS-domain-containing membrane protein